MLSLHWSVQSHMPATELYHVMYLSDHSSLPRVWWTCLYVHKGGKERESTPLPTWCTLETKVSSSKNLCEFRPPAYSPGGNSQCMWNWLEVLRSPRKTSLFKFAFQQLFDHRISLPSRCTFMLSGNVVQRNRYAIWWWPVTKAGTVDSLGSLRTERTERSDLPLH